MADDKTCSRRGINSLGDDISSDIFCCIFLLMENENEK